MLILLQKIKAMDFLYKLINFQLDVVHVYIVLVFDVYVHVTMVTIRQ